MASIAASFANDIKYTFLSGIFGSLSGLFGRVY
jgi:hypothetical protein